MNSYEIQIWEITKRADRKARPWRVRWAVGGVRFEELFRSKALANSFRSELVKASNAGEPFDTTTGRPASESRTMNQTTWYAHSRDYIQMKWPRAAAKTRRSIVEALTPIAMTLTYPTKRGRPADQVLREALYLYGFNPRRWSDEIPDAYAAALTWLEGASLPVVELDSPPMIRRVLDSLCVRLDGKSAAASTVQRKRATFYNALGYAVERELLASNPVDRVQWTAPEVAQAIDRRVVANPVQVAALLEAVESLGNRADRVTAFFGCLYYAGMRPSEAADLRRDDCDLPGHCPDCESDFDDLAAVQSSASCDHEKIEPRWGRLVLAGTAPRAGTHWTDDGQAHEQRGLKHRARKETRTVPIPPQLVELLAKHVKTYGVAPDGRFFRGLHGGPLSESVYDRWWKLARQQALTEPQVASPLVRRPYDLRHAAASLWLNAGVPATEVARRLGHGVAVLLRVYANCIDGGEGTVNDKIGGALQ
ncbi:tyrosine-type recombinase/integrase [Micromonospora sp. NBC_01699]|uniref:tyrosine-type recombinase/integrase n=1 Tax=Micromonospora sp. NBC_01699 TaxID=2975984 RepID=UPI002E2AC81F|nr:tyrosine-type recombinase/integrase [Micromonospora sp. NBC_01699]